MIGVLVSLIIIGLFVGSIYTIIKILDILFFKIYGGGLFMNALFIIDDNRNQVTC